MIEEKNILKTTTASCEFCGCPKCGSCLLNEEQTEAWDDYLLEDHMSTERVIKCSLCGHSVEVTLLPFKT